MRSILYAIVLALASGVHADIIPEDALVGFEVEATAAWVSTGLVLQPGDAFALTATGIAHESPASDERTPDGDGGGCGTCLITLPGSRYALVGRIGSHEFIVGSSFASLAEDAGTLELAFNDDFHGDNSGSYVASSARVPPLLTGLHGFGADSSGNWMGEHWNTFPDAGTSFNLWVIEGDLGGEFINGSDDAGSEIRVLLPPGDHTFSFHAEGGGAPQLFGPLPRRSDRDREARRLPVVPPGRRR